MFKQSKVKTCFRRQPLLVDFFPTLHFKVFSFGVLVLILKLMIVDFFVCIYRIIVHWYQHLYLSVIGMFLLAVSKPDIRNFLPRRFVEDRDEGAGYVVAIFIINELTGFKSIIPSSSCWFLFTLFLSAEEEGHYTYIYL